MAAGAPGACPAGWRSTGEPTLLAERSGGGRGRGRGAERDTIQANLLDLDNSFGKRLLAGATLTGESRQRWDTAAAALTTLWETFTAYSAVIDKAAELLAAPGAPRPPG